MKLHSEIPYAQYLSALHESIDNSFSFGEERFRGVVIGNFFSITHHAGHEWNRRITDEKNAALGFVRRSESGSDIRFILFKGMMCPGSFLTLLAVSSVLIFFKIALSNDSDMCPSDVLLIFGLIFALCVLFSIISALIEGFTDKSCEGQRKLLARLIDPTDPFSYLNHINELF